MIKNNKIQVQTEHAKLSMWAQCLWQLHHKWLHCYSLQALSSLSFTKNVHHSDHGYMAL